VKFTLSPSAIVIVAGENVNPELVTTQVVQNPAMLIDNRKNESKIFVFILTTFKVDIQFVFLFADKL